MPKINLIFDHKQAKKNLTCKLIEFTLNSR